MGCMPFELRRPWPQVHMPVRVDPAGVQGPTSGQAKGPRWRRVGHGWYVPSNADPALPEQRIVEAAVHVPAGGALTGWAALRAWGAGYFDGRVGARTLPVPLALGSTSGRRGRPGIELLYEELPSNEVAEVHGLRVAVPARALLDELRRPGPAVDAVVAADMALASRVTSWAQMDRLVLERTWFRRSHLALDALALADDRSRSPAETRLRVLCRLRLGLSALRPNCPVFTLDGDLVCIPDLFDELSGLVLEYDGAEHRTADRQHRDVLRAEACRAVGLEYCTVTSRDFRDTRAMGRRILAARQRGLTARASRAAWTTTPPPAWRMPW